MKIDLTKADIKDLVKEIEKRKKKMLPEIVENINENIKLLKELGVEIVDNMDCDYRLDEISIDKNGDVVFTTEDR